MPELSPGDQIYYLGQSGLEYKEMADAVKYGGGLKAYRVIRADKYVPMESALPPGYSPMPTEPAAAPIMFTPAPPVVSTTAAGDIQVPIPVPGYVVSTGFTPDITPAAPPIGPEQPNVPSAIDPGNLDAVGDAQLKEFLKSNGVKAVHLMGRAKLLEKTRALFTKPD